MLKLLLDEISNFLDKYVFRTIVKGGYTDINNISDMSDYMNNINGLF